MKITPQLFEAHLKCATKCWLRAAGEHPTGNTYAEWVQTQHESYRADTAKQLLATTPADDSAVAPSAESLKTAKWRLAVDVPVRIELRSSRGNEAQTSSPLPSVRESQPIDQSLLTSAATTSGAEVTAEAQIQIHAVERIPSERRGKAAQFIPIRFIFTNKLGKNDRLLLAFDALVLSQVLGREVSLGKIIHGDDHAALKVKTSALASEVRKSLDKIAALLSSPAPPDLVLNRHCAECEFQARCRKIAIEKDDLSLLAGMSAQERQKLRSKGIFTVTQLSYTFRPRRTPKRAKNPAKPRYLALQALAIRENIVYIHGTPTIPQSKTQVYLDIEGLPDRDFYYLVGALVVSEGNQTFHAFWAGTQFDEPAIFVQLAETISQLEDFHVFHFGDYDTAALKRMKSRLSEIYQQKIDMVLQKCTNVLSIVYPHVYFPTYSNNLKDIGRFLGLERSAPEATGLQSVIWRMTWSAEPDSALKAKLVDYNKADCETLERLTKFVVRQAASTACAEQGETQVNRTEEMNKARPRWRMFAPKTYALEDLQHINKCGYFDYQREKVFVRTNRAFGPINKNHRKLKRKKMRHSRLVDLTTNRCPACKSKKLQVLSHEDRCLLDLTFSKSGVKRAVTCFRCWQYTCQKCGAAFSSDRKRSTHYAYGHSLMSWCVYFNVVSGENLLRVQKNLEDLFGIYVSNSQIYRFKESIAVRYGTLYSELLQRILKSPVLHIDETVVNLRKQTGYVWVITSMDMVYYFYRPSREGSFLTEMIAPFSGILISDFYTAYDSLPCEQQKCLVHLVRELDEDLLHNPLDEQFKALAQSFGILLRTIIETVDRYGLRKRHLGKHKREVERFLRHAEALDHSSELVEKYTNRFAKYGGKIFTFLNHDGVPWNNDNAEHAIKRFAKYRRNADGSYTERSLKEYLVLASVLETCEFNNVNVLKFLLSKETTLDGLLGMAGRMTKHALPSSIPKII